MAYYGEEPAQILQSDATLEAAESAKFDLDLQAQAFGDERIFNIGLRFRAT